MSDAVTSEIQFSDPPKPRVSPLRARDTARRHRPFEGKVDTSRRKKFKAQTREMPKCPGVYFFYGPKERLLYIGIAKCLRERVRSYFADTSLPRPPKVKRLLSEMLRFEWQECGSELEALLLERRLIAELQPTVNRQLKQFEIYPYLLLTDEAFPRLTFTRAEPVEEGMRDEGGGMRDEEEEALFDVPDAIHPSALIPHPLENPPHLGELPGLYLGPFTTAHAARWTLEAVRNLFPLRTCEHEIKPDANGRACFLLEIKRCAGPCVAAVSREDYASLCTDLVGALHDGTAPQIERMRARMMRLAEDMRFEEAQQLKLQLEGIESVAARLSRLRRMRDQHNVAIVQPAKQQENQPPGVSIFLVRGGLVRRHFARVTGDDWTAIRKAIRDIYTAPLPAKPFTAKNELDEMMILDRWLRIQGTENCCVWLNDLSSRQWTAVATRRLEKWSQGQ